MRLSPLSIPGAFVMEWERHVDERGWFARTYDAEELASAGLDTAVAQTSVSFNPVAGTLRGMHLQRVPHAEAKVVRCTRGRIHDVLVDLRLDSPRFRHWAAMTLDQDEPRSLFVPAGVAHGFLTLVPDVELTYQISVPYEPSAADGVRWDDPAFGIEWPTSPVLLSDRDRDFPDFTW